LNESLRQTPGVTLISAPAGFGKTTLLSEWVNRGLANAAWRDADQPPTVAWISLDKNDNDPARFLAYLIAALQSSHPDIGAGTLSMLESPQSPPIEALLSNLLNEISAAEQHLVLILDDYQLIDSQSVHNAVSFLLDHVPLQLHLMIASRSEPPLQLARLRARGILIEMRAAELRFSVEEASQFLNSIIGLNLGVDDIALLDRRIEGWAAGLQLAGLSLKGRPATEKPGFVNSISGDDRFIADYLVEEVLQHHSPAVQDFLLHTSLLDRLSNPLCNAVIEQADSQSVLEFLERSNLFIVPLDNKREWYRYHRLFAELLQSRLQRTRPDLVPVLHRRASAWHESVGSDTEAVNHALSGQDYKCAIRLIALNTREMLKRGEAATLWRWLRQLPPEEIRTDPHLSVASAWASMFTGPVDNLEPTLQGAEQAIGNLTDTADAGRRELLAEVKAIRAIATIEQGNTAPTMIRFARQTLDDLPKQNRFLYTALETSLALAYRANGDTNSAIELLTEAKSIAEQSDNIFSNLFIGYELAELSVEHGQLQRAAALHRQALSLVEDRFGSGAEHIPLAGAAHIGLGKLLYEWNDLEAARLKLEQGIHISSQRGGIGFPRQGAVAMAFLCQALGDGEAANNWMQQAEEMARSAPRPQVLAQVLLKKVRLNLAQGRLTAARRWLDETSLDVTDLPTYPDEPTFLTLIRSYLSLKDQQALRSTLPVLGELRQRVESQQRLGRAVEIATLQALVCQTLGQSERALEALEHGLSLAEPEAYTRCFVNEGPPMFDLLQLALAQKISPAYTSRLLAACKTEQVRLTSLGAAQPLVEPLTRRELEVLNLLAAGLTNQEIADTLTITVGTVKRHTINIYGKLDVNNRTQAVAKARELHLVE
jgi:LuxR family maltose regulon positive regulatory protein